jgi:hypothetical protein
MNYIFAIAIITFWIMVVVSFSWDPKVRFRTNFIIIMLTVLVLGLIYWVPFWLIFLR